MRGMRTAIGLGLALALLAACANEEPPPAAPVRTPKHVSPAPIAPATVPEGTFDQTQAQTELAAAISARQDGDPARARALTEASLAHWPASVEAWAELLGECRAAADADCTRYAAFFHDKVDSVSGLPPRVAMLGFQNISHGSTQGVNGRQEGFDERTLKMARHLEAFYNLQDIEATRTKPARSQDFLDRNPSTVMIGVLIGGAIGTGVYYAGAGNHGN